MPVPPAPLRPLPPAPGHDVRSWIALVVVLAAAALAAWRWPWLRWVAGIALVAALLHAVHFVLSARAAGRDPEAKDRAR